MIVHRMPTDFIYRSAENNQNYTPPMQIGDHYVIYEIVFASTPDGEFALMQTVGLSMTLQRPDGALVNTEPHLCGAIVTTGVDNRFLHPETIMELVRHGYGLVLKNKTVALYQIHDDPALLLVEPEGTA